MEEIAANGIDGASYNRIIERSGLSKGVVYYYFENKESLYLTVLDEVERQFLASVGKLKLPETREEFWTACRLYYEKAIRYGAGNLGIVKVVRNLIDPGTGMKEAPNCGKTSGSRAVDRQPSEAGAGPWGNSKGCSSGSPPQRHPGTGAYHGFVAF